MIDFSYEGHSKFYRELFKNISLKIFFLKKLRKFCGISEEESSYIDSKLLNGF